MDRDELIKARRSVLFALALTPVAALAQSSGSLSTRRSASGGSNAYDVTFAYPGQIPNLLTFPLIAFPRAVSWVGNIVGSRGNCGTNPTSTATFTLYKNAVTVGSVNVSVAGAFTFTTLAGAAVSWSIGDVLEIQTPAVDATLASVTMTFLGST